MPPLDDTNTPTPAPTPTPEPTPEPTPTPAPTPEPEDSFTSFEVGEGDQPPAAASSEDPKQTDSEVEKGKEKSEEAPKPYDQEAARLLAEKDREVEYWRGVAEGRKPAEEPGTPAPTPEEDELKEPNPEDYLYGETDRQFIADLAKYEGKKAYREEQYKAELAAEVAKVQAGWNAQIEAAKVVYSDFEEVVVKGAAEEKWPCSQIMALGIHTSPVGGEMAYRLAKDPAEARRISNLDALSQAKEIGRLEAKVEFEAAAKVREAEGQPKPQPNKVSSAPPPAPQVRGAGGKFGVSADTDDFAAFEAHADLVLEAAAKSRH